VTAADDTGVTLDVDGSPRQLPWAQVGRGKVQVEFNRTSDARGASDDGEED
jgi:ribosome maturation factor RimP